MPGVHAVLTHDDVPGSTRSVSSTSTSRCWPSTWCATRASRSRWSRPTTPRPPAGPPHAIEVDYEELAPVTDARAPLTRRRRAARRRQHRAAREDPHGAAARPPVVVSGDYEVGMQDQAFLGPESGLAVPAGTAGSTCTSPPSGCTSTAPGRAALGLDEDLVRLTLAGVGGAFGGREDLSMQVHACMLALRTGRPVKMVYYREESFFGHVHRHPARMHYEHGADEDGRWSTAGRRSCSTAAPTPRARRPSSPTRRPRARAVRRT